MRQSAKEDSVRQQWPQMVHPRRHALFVWLAGRLRSSRRVELILALLELPAALVGLYSYWSTGTSIHELLDRILRTAGGAMPGFRGRPGLAVTFAVLNRLVLWGEPVLLIIAIVSCLISMMTVFSSDVRGDVSAGEELSIAAAASAEDVSVLDTGVAPPMTVVRYAHRRHMELSHMHFEFTNPAHGLVQAWGRCDTMLRVPWAAVRGPDKYVSDAGGKGFLRKPSFIVGSGCVVARSRSGF